MIVGHAPRIRRGVYDDMVTKVTNETRGKVARAYDRTGDRTVKALQDYTGEMRPPVRAGDPPRPAHPGHWADISFDLRDNYGYVVVNNRLGVRLRVWNKSDHAIYLEHREGYFVLTGVFEDGGIGFNILDEELRRQGLRRT
jgi:hypothetical protein